MNNISGEKKPEMITDKNGKVIILSGKSVIDHKKINDAIILMGKCVPTIEEAAKNIKSASEALSKLKNIQIKKATN